MSSKTKRKPAPSSQKAPTVTLQPNSMVSNFNIPGILVLMYLASELIPQGGATDVMGPQWLYITILDIVCALYFMSSRRPGFDLALSRISKLLLTILYTSFFVLSGISILVAINKIESLVCFARFTATLFMFFNLAILLYDHKGILNLLSAVLTAIIGLQSLMVIIHFSQGYGVMDLNQLILGLRGTAGNKNILASSLVIKLPFLLYGMYHTVNWKKWLYVASFTLCCFAIALLNARAAYVSFISIIILYLLFLLWQKKGSWFCFTAVLLPVLIGFGLSAVALRNAAAMQEKDTYFGNLGERLSSIAMDAKGSGHRLPLWHNAVNYISQHPLMGTGYGNWKLASIPYETTVTKDFEVNYHVHNDFLEAATETGTPGALLFLSIFICAGFYLFKTIKNKTNSQASIITFFCLMGLWAYVIDACFNFPAERPVMQLYLALWLAITVNCYLQVQRSIKHETTVLGKGMKYYSLLSLLLLIPATWLAYTTYISMKAQYDINPDVQAEPPQKTYEEVNQSLPNIPNLNSFCMPVAIIKANYLFREKQFDQALALIKEGQKANPYLPYDDLLLSKIYKERNRPDSALFYAKQGFEKRPKSAALYQQLNAASFGAKDTATLNQAFSTFNQYRSESWAWNEYLNYLYDLPHDTTRMRLLVDSALRLFPGDSYLQHKKTFLEQKR